MTELSFEENAPNLARTTRDSFADAISRTLRR